MIHDRPPRLPPHAYIGLHRYHVRISTWNRARYFEVPETTIWALEQLLQRACAFGFAIRAYCFMPDHVHLMLEACSDDASLVRLIGHWKQATGFQFKQRHGVRLWQASFFDRVLRENDSSAVVAAYILGNPVRAGISSSVGEYPFAWCVWGNDLEGNTRG